MSSLSKQTLIPAADIDEHCLSGFHRCCLEEPYHLDYASQNLCDMLGYTATEIHNLFHDKYSLMIYEQDRPRFIDFIHQLASKEQTLTLSYRMICKDGHMIYLQDTMTSRHLEDGKMYGFAIVADVSSRVPRIRTSNSQIMLAKLMESYGFLRCTCEKYPKITYINDHMRKYLHISEESSNWKEFLQENIFFMIPLAERDFFRNQLDCALHTTEPVHIEHQIVRSDGSMLLLTGWINLIENEYGEKEYAITYMNMGKNRPVLSDNRESSYFNALKSAYQLIFEINYTKNTVQCIHGRNTSDIGAISDISMTIDSAKNFWLNNYVMEEDREMTREYFNQITTPDCDWNGSTVLQGEFRILWTNHVTYHLLGVAVKLDSSTVLLCCRDVSNVKYTLPQSRESVILKKWNRWMEYFVRENEAATVGMGLLEQAGDTFSLLYLSPNILTALSIERHDYLRTISGEYPIEQFLSRVCCSQPQFQKLIATNHLYLTLKTNPDAEEKSYTLTCKPYPDRESTLYEVFVYEAYPAEDGIASDAHIFARTFGHFDLFVDNRPVSFSSDKEKELLALLVDRNGGTLSPVEAIGYLWEDEEINEKINARYRKLAMGLKNTLKKYGVESILLNNHGVRCIDVNAIECDYYGLLAGEEKYKNAFHNIYMADYSWGEETLAALWDYS